MQKTCLAGVSTRLAEYCCQQISELSISQEALHIFLAWLISRDLNKVTITRESLAEARNLGAQYNIPDSQDAVMHKLVPFLRDDCVDPDAVIKAYENGETDTKLQRALTAQPAIDMRRGNGYKWIRSNLKKSDMQDVPGFYLDLTNALREADQDAELEIGDFLFKQ